MGNEARIKAMDSTAAAKAKSAEIELKALKRQTKYLNIINEFSIALMELNDLDEVYRYVTKDVVARLGFDDCVIYILNQDTQMLEQVSANGVKSTQPGEICNVVTLPLGSGIVGNCAQNGDVIIVNDTREDSRYIADIHPALSEIAVPIVREGNVIGVIDCENEHPNAYNEEHKKILLTVAAILSTKMQKSLALDELQQSVSKLEYAESLQAALYRIASLKSDADNIKCFYQEIHSIVGSLLFAKNFFIALYDESSELLNFPYYCDEFSDVDPTQSFSRNMLEHSLSGWVFRNQQPLLATPDVIEDMQNRGECMLFGSMCESWLGVPFESGDSVKGVVVVQSYDKNQVYLERDKELLIFVSQHISHALERIFSEQKLQHQALHDALTGLPNRVLFMDRVVHALDRLKRHNHDSVSVMYLDLDKFKNINDTLGHLVGDDFLVQVSQMILENIRNCDTLARLGGDEFAILLEDISEPAEALEVAERVITALKTPVVVGPHKLATSVSIGIAFSERKIEAVDLIKHADTAMYKAKDQGRATYCVFEREMLADESAYVRMDLEIRDALAKREFTLFYQPIYKTACSNIIGMEALVRWQHKERGLVFPDEFIEFAEEFNLIVGIDRYVMELAAKQMAQWQDKFEPGFYISVNVSGKNFTSVDFVEYVLYLQEKHNLRRGVFAIEITERALIDNVEQAKINLEQLRDEGIQIFLDDFGTGYSSLSYLHQFPLDCLKIDRSFINNMSGSKFDNPLVKMIIALAKSLNLKVVAEGIEKPNQQNCLDAMECDYGQGYMFSKPVTADEIEQRFILNREKPFADGFGDKDTE